MDGEKLEDKSGDLTDWKARAENAERELAVRAAMGGVNWLDPDDAFRELSAAATLGEDGKWVVPAAKELAERKPHWVKAAVAGGTGAGGGVAGGGGVTLDELLKPQNAERLKEMIHNRPREYQRLWEMKFGNS
jgi:hypothetical protein